MGLFLPLLLCTGEEVKGRPCRRVGKVEPAAGQQLPHVLNQFEVGPGAQWYKGCLSDTENLCIPELVTEIVGKFCQSL